MAAYASCPSVTCSTPRIDAGCNWGVGGREQHPINCVNWNQARAYCRSLGGDLPTEAQWEYAARGMDGRLYPWGNDAPTYLQACWSRPGPCPVRSFPSSNSPFGIFDMAGNVWEWTLDYYATYTGSASSYVLNPTNPFSGALRVLRGGSSQYSPRELRSSYRYTSSATSSPTTFGFRCARGAM